MSQLILIPHRDLHRLPVDAVFPERFIITYLPSAQVGINLQQPRANGQQLLSVENPQSNLPYANIESTVIRELFYPYSPPSIMGQQATRTQVMTALQTYQQLGVFHFAGHAEHDINQPLESALLLAEPDKLTLRDILQPELDVKLKTLIYRFHSDYISVILWFIYFLYQVHGLPLDISHCRLVYLSACETGITGKEDLINEFVGLVSGFLAAGATSVVSSLWVVDSPSTAFLTIKFYEYLNRGDSLAVALKKAQRWLQNLTCEEFSQEFTQPQYQQAIAQLQQRLLAVDFFELEDAIEVERRKLQELDPNEKPFSHPYYWAAFIPTGV